MSLAIGLQLFKIARKQKRNIKLLQFNHKVPKTDIKYDQIDTKFLINYLKTRPSHGTFYNLLFEDLITELKTFKTDIIFLTDGECYEELYFKQINQLKKELNINLYTILINTTENYNIIKKVSNKVFNIKDNEKINEADFGEIFSI